MPLSYYRIVCGTCERVISNGWPPDAPPELCVLSRQTCRECEADAVAMDTAEAAARRQVRA